MAGDGRERRPSRGGNIIIVAEVQFSWTAVVGESICDSRYYLVGERNVTPIQILHFTVTVLQRLKEGSEACNGDCINAIAKFLSLEGSVVAQQHI